MEINIEINPSILVHRTFNLKLEHNRFRKFGIYLEVKKKNIDIFLELLKKKKKVTLLFDGGFDGKSSTTCIVVSTVGPVQNVPPNMR